MPKVTKRLLKLSSVLKIFFGLAILAIGLIVAGMISLMKTQEKEIMENSYEFNQVFIRTQLDHFEEMRCSSVDWNDEYTIEYLILMTECYDREVGIIARVLDNNFKPLSTPNCDKHLGSCDDLFIIDNEYQKQIKIQLHQRAEGEVTLKYKGNNLKLYMRAYPLKDKEVYLVIGVSPEILIGRSIFTQKLIFLFLVFLILVVSTSFYISLQMISADRILKRRLSDLVKTIEIPKDK